MIIPKDELGEIFDKIHNVWIQTRTTVVILSAADCDSICTTKILTSLLATEMISYTIQPVLSYEHIARHNDTSLQQQIRAGELHTVIMINCGAIVDLNHLLFVRPIVDQYRQNKQDNNDEDNNNRNNDEDSDLDEMDNIDNADDDEKLNTYIDSNLQEINNNFRIYVVDSHRPFNLMNVHNDSRIYLLQGEDEQSLDAFPRLIDFEDEEFDNAHNNKENEFDEDFDDDFDLEDFGEPSRKKRKLNNNTTLKKKNNISDKQRELIRLQREQDEYYKYQYYSLNSSSIMYLMARSIQKDDNAMLWMTILGLTESFIYEKIDRDKYNESVSIYCDEVSRRNKTYNNISTMDAECKYNLDSAGANIENSSIITHRDISHIQFSTEFRFTLMRFWTLYDSMYYSRYVATSLGVWKQRGKDNLKYMLAKMALPLNEAKQPYNSMKREYKRRLPQLFADNIQHGGGGLDDNLTFGSFTKQHGGHQSISASDMVYAITAVLESDFRVNQNQNQKILSEESKEKKESLVFDDSAWQSNFFYGYDALSVDKQYLLKVAIELAKERQCEIVNMGIRLIEKRTIKTLGIMRYCCIENSNTFQAPMLLCKLALFIMDAFRAQTNKSAKHFVLASFNDKLNSYTVVGIPAKKYIGDVNKSPFYTSFEESRKRVNANAKIVFFEGHVIQIHKDHFLEWLENLHERLLSYAF